MGLLEWWIGLNGVDEMIPSTLFNGCEAPFALAIIMHFDFLKTKIAISACARLFSV